MNFFANDLVAYWYAAAALAVVVFVLRKELRLKMYLAGVLVLPAVLIKPLITTGYLAIFSENGGLLGFWFPRAMLAISLGSLLVALYESTLAKKVSPAYHPARSKLLLLAAGLAVFAIFRFGLQLDFLSSVLAGLIANVLIVLVYERNLIWDVFFAGFGMSLIYLLVFLQVSFGLPGDYNNLWFGGEVVGVTFWSLPLEEILAVILFGALFGPLYVALKDVFVKNIDAVNFSREHLRLKIIFGRIFLVVGVLLLVWLANNFLLMPKVSQAIAEVGAEDAEARQIKFNFDRPVYRPNLTVKITPPVAGYLRFEDSLLANHMYSSAVFVAQEPLLAGGEYKILLEGISNIFGLGSETHEHTLTVPSLPLEEGSLRNAVVPPGSEPESASSTAGSTTPVLTPKPAPTVTRLDIAVDYQDKPLSCEAAALKMALSHKKVFVSEDDIMAIVGFDPTVHQDNIWGDPDAAFVGSINGRQNTTGYGVHWGPVARAANHFRPAQDFTGWQVADLSRAIAAGHPVVIWGVIGNAYPETWYTPEGKEVKAWKGEHTFVVIGFTGSRDNPQEFIINDPISGRQTWSAEKLRSNWSTFNNSGVVVY